MANTLKNLEVISSNLLTGILTIGAYLFAGHARISIHDTVKAVRYSYRVKVVRRRTAAGGYAPAHGVGPWTVELRVQHGWAALGYIALDPHTDSYRFLAESCGRWQGRPIDHPGAVWFFRGLLNDVTHGHELPDRVQVWRSNHCGRCGKDLVSEFRHIGFGPECCGYLGIDARRIFRRLADLGAAPLNERIATVRAMVHADLEAADRKALNLLPGVAGEYARQHLAAG